MAWLSTRLTLLSLACLALGPALAHFRVVAPLHGFLAFLASGALGLLALALALLCLPFQGSRASVAPWILPALIPVAAIGALYWKSRQHPRLNDVATDLALPLPIAGAPPLPEASKSQIRARYPELGPYSSAEDPARLYARALELARSSPGWEVTREDPGSLAFEGFEESALFRFRDDFSVQVLPGKPGAVLQMRSRSRDGKGDFGMNAARIRRFIGKLQEKDGR
jgi:uncharacterized protein (DUF1499 family)